MKQILVFLACVSSSLAQAQPKTSFDKGDAFFRINPLGLVDPVETNASVGLEYRLKNDLSLSMDAGYIFYSADYKADGGRSSGFIFRPAVRYYPGERTKFFVETEFSYKQVNTKITDWIRRECINEISTYESFSSFLIRKNVTAYHFKIGKVSKISRNEKLWLEMYMGLGIKVKKNTLPHEVNSCYRFNQFSLGQNQVNPSKQNYSNLPMGLRLLIKL